MVCREITDRKIWEDFLLRCEEKTFLQAWNWGEFQQRMGNKIWRLGTYEDVHPAGRSEERRVGKECRSRWSPYH